MNRIHRGFFQELPAVNPEGFPGANTGKTSEGITERIPEGVHAGHVGGIPERIA